MRVKPEEIERIVGNILSNLKKKNLIVFKTKEDTVKDLMMRIFMGNLEEEAKLDLAVEEILKKFQSEIDSGKVDYRKMFQKVKVQLAKEKKFVL
jgi:uncharacterized protein